MGLRPLASAAVGREHVTGQMELSGFVVGKGQHKLGCRCRACKMIRTRKREKAVRNYLEGNGISSTIYD